MFQRGGQMEYVRAGAAFRRVRRDETVETAQISQVYIDPQGIPHVRFDVHFKHPRRSAYKDGPRVLAISTFFQTFQERA
jgi:hypothetical protein